ncbi:MULTISPECIES: glycosyltransferase family 4 protein [unclassified Micromonospora]|uniref:glycosyltransferase family 4 protein n=1 Tax=unclassified Micromonospora TaxID=2617518 RepID=UPI001B367E16|nr:MULTISPECIES: glycosyltransferase family 4 protein [unclassified Micromonospora]MBQ1043345.1 glycosyltransferase family 4 protein [Micromonospora sp. C72]MBQ1056449.1 glycosyltransferase family 4 protein [Micromonospora sp. C32]
MSADLGRGGADATRIALVTQWFPPEPTGIPLGIARSLEQRDFAVDVLTGVPNYPTGVVPAGYRAHRRSVEDLDGLRVLRAPLYPSHDRSAVRRAANYLSWAASSTVVGRGLLRSADASLVYGSPITAATAAMAARMRWRTPYVLMVMDLWPDSVFATGFLTDGAGRRLAAGALGGLTDRVHRWADHITVPSPGLRRTLIERGIPADKVSVVYNWADEKVMQPAEPDPTFRARLGLGRDDFVVMYAGNLGAAQRLDVAVAAMEHLRDLPDVHLVLVGGGVERESLRERARAGGLATVHFADQIAPERIASAMAATQLQLISLADEPLFHITLPGKVQAILASGQPALVCAPGDAARIVTGAGAGFAAPPGDPAALAAVIRQARSAPRDRLRDMGHAARRHYLAHMSEEINAQVLADLLTDAVRRRGADGRGRRRKP